MPWWGWLLLAWPGAAVACGAWLGGALANAELQDAARRVTEDVAVSEDSPAS
jgi:hypothetical protein